MKEEKKHLYRIDPLKVRQKLFDMYPKGSEAHKMMAKEEKIKEYTSLAKAITSMPIEVVTQLAEKNKALVFTLILKALGLGAVTVILGATVYITTTPLEVVLLGTGIALSFLGSLHYLFNAMKIAYSIKSFEDELLKIRTRMDKLQKDIF